MLIPEGYYPGIAVPNKDGKWMVFGTADNEKKTRQVSVDVKFTDGEHAGTVRTWIGYFTEATVDKTLEQLRNFGAQGDDMSVWPDQALTEPVSLCVKHEPTLEAGKVRDRIAWINRPGGGGFVMKKQMNADDLRTFAAQMKGRLATKPAIKRAEAPKAPDVDL